MHDWSTVPGMSVPPPVTRQVTGVSQLTEAAQLLGAVLTACPQMLLTQGTAVVTCAVPVTVMLKGPPGHETITQAGPIVASPPAGTVSGNVGVTGVVWSAQSTSGGRPLTSTLRGIELELCTVSVKVTGAFTVSAGSVT